MFKRLRRVAVMLSVLMFACQAGVAVSETAAKPAFHFEAPISEGTASLRRAALPWEVLSGLVQQRQTDLRVYNADGQLVPFAIRNRVTPSQATLATHKLDFFSGDNPVRLSKMLVMQSSLNAAQIAQLQQPEQHYLIIPNREEEGRYLSLHALRFHWNNLQQWLPKSLAVESSDDLLHWQSVGFARLPYVLSERGVVLENHTLKFNSPVTQRFIRLSGRQDFAPLLPALQYIDGDFKRYTEHQMAERWQSVALVADDKPQTYRYDAPVSLPLNQWRLVLPDAGHLYEGELYSRHPVRSDKKRLKLTRKSQSGWRHRANFQHYYLQTQAGEVRSEASSATGLSGQQWQLHFNQPLPTGFEPRIELAWQPLELYFIAQGRGPFLIRYGSHDAKPIPAMHLDQKLMDSGVEKVDIGVAKQLVALKAAADSPVMTSWLKLLLWGVLVGSVVFLLWMAKRLWKEIV